VLEKNVLGVPRKIGRPFGPGPRRIKSALGGVGTVDKVRTGSLKKKTPTRGVGITKNFRGGDPGETIKRGASAEDPHRDGS